MARHRVHPLRAEAVGVGFGFGPERRDRLAEGAVDVTGRDHARPGVDEPPGLVGLPTRTGVIPRLEPPKTFACRLKAKLDGVLAYCRWPLHTSLLEGINNKNKVIKRMADGYRDDESFFRRVRAAFPGNPG